MADDITTTLAHKHGISVDAVVALKDALQRGGGRQAQFSHRDLGGMGQWSAGGMTQVGDMFNNALRDKVNALCTELARGVANEPTPAPKQQTPDSNHWWPGDLGRASATGAQNGMRYACFPDTHRVAIKQEGRVTVYDSGDHRISGVSQQQSGTQDLSFSSQNGTVRAADMPVVG
ncbi:SHOCT domain-containing protein [Acidisphaera sp. L21]|uniref:SHOCT domain-containing protein n=1 Tax=Acidisphaera sp. L21 TaxID=1641851 RepID=UPI00131E6EE8|nr:SHOCT domain-containing protein [Acidisphaera sp. L21]